MSTSKVKSYAKYENDEFFKRWLTGLSPDTKEHYSNEIVGWITFVGMTPTEQIRKRMHDLTSQDIIERTFFEGQFCKYKEYLENKGTMKPLAVRTQLTAVASFFTRNNLPLSLKKGDWSSTTQQTVIQRFKLTREDVRAMYQHANLRDRALLLVLGQSGMSEVDVSVLHVEDFPELYSKSEGGHLFFEKPREKTNEVQATCISAEALHDIRAMLQERGNPTSGWLFVGQTKSKNAQLEVRTINEAIKSLAQKSLGKERAKDFQTKTLRSFYNSALLRADLKQEIKDLMMGHARMGARGHYDYDEETIVNNYKKAFEFLSVNGIQTKSDLAKLKSEFELTKTELLKILTDQQKKLDDAYKEIDALKVVYEVTKPLVDNIDLLLPIVQKAREEKERAEAAEAEKKQIEEALADATQQKKA